MSDSFYLMICTFVTLSLISTLFLSVIATVFVGLLEAAETFANLTLSAQLDFWVCESPLSIAWSLHCTLMWLQLYVFKEFGNMLILSGNVVFAVSIQQVWE